VRDTGGRPDRSEIVRRDDEQVLQLQHRLVRGAAAQVHGHLFDADAAASVRRARL
jgi:hypothetical protein